MSAIFGERLWFEQERGEPVQLVAFGDEFYSWYETLDGYTVVYDQDAQRYCFALLASGAFASSGIPLAKSPPATLRRHLREDARVRREKFGRRYMRLRPPEPMANPNIMRTLGRANGLLEGRRVSEGNVRGLTILVDFPDLPASISAADVDKLLNGEQPLGANACTVQQYFARLSCNKLQYTNHVVGPIRMPHTRSYYRNVLIVPDALRLAVEKYNIDLTQFDSRGEGIVDALSVMYAGRTAYDGNLWPHNSTIVLNFGNVRTHYYMLTSMGRKPVDLTIGTFCHENGHMLCRFPDLYDYGTRDGDEEPSQGLGRYCLMSSGNHLDQGRTPSPVCAYLRHLVGWPEREVSLADAGTIRIEHGDYATLYRFPTAKPNEFFLVENRCRQALDASLPASGLAVYHCDTRGSNEWQDATASRHYQCALLQADQHLDLESNRNGGDDGDLFGAVEGVALSHDTTPSTRMWDGSDSGLTISSISAPGGAVALRVGPPETKRTIKGQIACDSLIPDNDLAGIEVPIHLDALGTAAAIRVSVQIQHTYVGDLRVELVAPSGKRVVLRDRSGGPTHDLRDTYETGSTRTLDELIGEHVPGDWKLHVTDLASRDVGRLDHWGIEVDWTPVGNKLEKRMTPEAAIPDNDTTGITSTIGFDGPGAVHAIEVDVDIAHTFVGDLQVELVAPSGRIVSLHDREGGAQHNLVATWTSSSHAGLAGLVGETIDGGWALQVRDVAREDSGVLRAWGLRVVGAG